MRIIIAITTLVFMRLGWLSGFEFVMLMMVAGWAVINDAVELLDRLDAMGGDGESGSDDGDDSELQT